MKKIAILVASSGMNLKLANKLAEVASDMEVETQIIDLVDLNLPLYSTAEEKIGIPDQAINLANTMKAARAMIVVVPEYNGSVPPVFINAIAWVSRSSEDWRAALNGKMAAIATHSGGGGAHALMALRQQLSYCGVNVLGRQMLTNYSKELNVEAAKQTFTDLTRLS
jgi:chromate reductase, NAD(P)H dehydrogenase (quinone)